MNERGCRFSPFGGRFAISAGVEWNAGECAGNVCASDTAGKAAKLR